MSKSKINKMALSAIFTAIIAATAWISLPTPFGVSLTLQIFGVCLAGLVLGAKGALAATSVYIALGATGLPVFSLFTGGVGILFGASGGFLWGFMLTAVLCGITINQNKKTVKYPLLVFAVLLCHLTGIIQFSLVSGVNVWAAFLSASLPFLLKDIILVFVAEFIANKIKTKIKI